MTFMVTRYGGDAAGPGGCGVGRNSMDMLIDNTKMDIRNTGEELANYYYDIYDSIKNKKFSTNLISIKDELFIFNALNTINKSANSTKWTSAKKK